MTAEVKKTTGNRVGDGTPGPGRPKGKPNKATADVREAFALLLQRNVGKMESWLQQVAETDPARATGLMLDLAEYHIPKLARTELTGKDGKDLTIIWPLSPNPLDQ